jgi:glycosyltransferase involved in cell wall biosynthesis
VRTCVVIPCYNEQQRLDESAFERLAKTEHLELLFVDDGSTDGTLDVLRRLAQVPATDVLELAHNVGKGEAVRRGMVHALEHGATEVAYYDADMSAPPDELVRLVWVLAADPTLSVVLASRVAKMGSAIERSALRHYLGRLFATAASVALGADIYDTQCGLKVFRDCPELRRALAEPFRADWAFDVVLLDRLLGGVGGEPGLPASAFLEVPLVAWKGMAGSKLSAQKAARAVLDVAMLGMRRRTGSGGAA